MKFKLNPRTLWGVSIPLLFIGVIAGLGITYRSGTLHGAGKSSSMPWEQHIDLVGTDYIRYFFNAVKERYVDYPWVVQISYLIVVLCILAVFVLLILMAKDIFQRKKEARLFRTLQTKYYTPLR